MIRASDGVRFAPIKKTFVQIELEKKQAKWKTESLTLADASEIISYDTEDLSGVLEDYSTTKFTQESDGKIINGKRFRLFSSYEQICILVINESVFVLLCPYEMSACDWTSGNTVTAVGSDSCLTFDASTESFHSMFIR